MLQEPNVTQSESNQQSTAHVVHALMQFLIAARYRKNVVITALVITALVGGLYYATATRYYAARAEVLVMYAGKNQTQGLGADTPGNMNLMPTFESLFTSAAVVGRALEKLRPEDRIDLAGLPKEAWVSVLQAGLSSRALHNRNIIEVSYRSKDSRTAVNVVNAVVEAYAEFLEETHKGSASDMIRLLTEQTSQMEQSIDSMERELLAAQMRIEDIGVRADGGTLHPKIKRVVSFNEKLIETQQERVALEASLTAIQQSLNAGEDLRHHVMTVADAVGNQVLMQALGVSPADAYVQAEFERSILEDQAKLQSAMAELGELHPQVTELKTKIFTTQQFLRDSHSRINARLDAMQNHELGTMLMQMVRQKVAELRQLEITLAQEYETAQHNAVGLAADIFKIQKLEEDLEWRRTARKEILDKLADISLWQGGQEVSTAVVQPPVELIKPVSPNLKRLILMVLAGGMLIGLGVVYVLDTLDDRFRSAEELQVQLDVPVLAMVQQLPLSDETGPGALQVHVAPNATESEAFRTLRTALALADREARQIVISSAEPGDGKTTVLANLAVSYAQAEKRTLLIDADLRRPGMTALMGMRGVDGLSGIIRNDRNVVEMASETIQPSGIDGLDVLASGPRPTNPAELLAHPRFAELLAWAETVYDQVLIDSPPVLATSDAHVIGRLVDGLVLVVQPEKNRRRVVVRAAESLHALKIPLLGVAVNRVGAEGNRGYYGYNGGYAYNYGADPTGDVVDLPDERTETAEAPPEDLVPEPVVPMRPSLDLEEDPLGPIVPRRVG